MTSLILLILSEPGLGCLLHRLSVWLPVSYTGRTT